MKNKTPYILCVILIGCFFSTPAFGQANGEKPKKVDDENKPTKYIPTEREKLPWINGVAVGVDIVGPIMMAASANWYQLMACARMSIKEKFFPVFEFGVGHESKEGKEQSNNIKTTAPYFTVGLDFNLNKKVNGNRFFIGARYGFSSYTYDITALGVSDPIWKDTRDVYLENLHGSLHWVELVVGFETKIWRFIRLGYSGRLKGRINQTSDEIGEPDYIPGFGVNGSTCFGGTFNVMFDIGWKKKDQTKKIQHKETISQSTVTEIIKNNQPSSINPQPSTINPQP